MEPERTFVVTSGDKTAAQREGESSLRCYGTSMTP